MIRESTICNFIKGKKAGEIVVTFISYFIKIILYPIILLFLPKYLKEASLGIWYSFVSIGALSTLVDLGFTAIISQFAAHELGKNTNLSQNDKLKSLYKFCRRWNSIVFLVSFVLVFAAGLIIFRSYDLKNIILQWTLYVFGVCLVFLAYTRLSFFEGCGKMVQSQLIKMLGATMSNILLIVALVAGMDLWSIAIYQMTLAVMLMAGIYIFFHKEIRIFNDAKTDESKWAKDIWKLIWRYTVSWIGGYLAFQMFNPIFLRLLGAESAGKLGYLLSIIAAVATLSQVWVYVANPKINFHIASGNRKTAIRYFLRSTIMALITYVVGIIMLILLLFLLKKYNIWQDKILPISYAYPLILAYLMQTIVYGSSMYLRAHKEEPLMKVSIIHGVLTVILTIIFSKYAPQKFIFFGALIGECIIMPIVIVIVCKYIKKDKLKIEYDGENA